MKGIARRGPSTARAALVVASIALIAAVAGDSIAEVATKALTKKEKRQTRKIATKKVEELAPGLSVNFANSANSAGSAGSAANADAVDGVSAANPFAQAQEGDPRVHLGTFGGARFDLFCSSGVNSTFLDVRATSGTAVYHELGTGAVQVIDDAGAFVETVSSNNTATIGFTVNQANSSRSASGTLTLRHSTSGSGICQIYGTLLGS